MTIAALESQDAHFLYKVIVLYIHVVIDIADC